MAQLSGMFIYPVVHLSGVYCIYIYSYGVCFAMTGGLLELGYRSI